MDAARGPTASVVPRRQGTDATRARESRRLGRLPWPAEDSPSGLWRSPGTRVGLIALRGSNPLSSALGPRCDRHDEPGRTPARTHRLEEEYAALDRGRCGTHRSSSSPASLYFFFVLPRWFELTGAWLARRSAPSLRIVCGALIGLAALPVVFTLLRTRKPEFGTPQLALTLRIVVDRAARAGRRADRRRRDQRDLAQPRHRRPVAVRHLRRRRGDRASRRASPSTWRSSPSCRRRRRSRSSRRRRRRTRAVAAVARPRTTRSPTMTDAEETADDDEADRRRRRARRGRATRGGRRTVRRGACRGHRRDNPTTKPRRAGYRKPSRRPTDEDVNGSESSDGKLRNRRPIGKMSLRQAQAVSRRRRRRRLALDVDIVEPAHCHDVMRTHPKRESRPCAGSTPMSPADRARRRRWRLVAPISPGDSVRGAAGPVGDRAQVEPAVVRIDTTINYQHAIGAGTGIVLDPNGEVLTNFHVVQGADIITAHTSAPAVLRRRPGRLRPHTRHRRAAAARRMAVCRSHRSAIRRQLAAGEPVVALGNASGSAAR